MKSWDITQKAQFIKEKNNKVDLIKIKIFCSVKDFEKDERKLLRENTCKVDKGLIENIQINQNVTVEK